MYEWWVKKFWHCLLCIVLKTTEFPELRYVSLPQPLKSLSHFKEKSGYPQDLKDSKDISISIYLIIYKRWRRWIIKMTKNLREWWLKKMLIKKNILLPNDFLCLRKWTNLHFLLFTQYKHAVQHYYSPLCLNQPHSNIKNSCSECEWTFKKDFTALL